MTRTHDYMAKANKKRFFFEAAQFSSKPAAQAVRGAIDLH
jgi:hypothetical protein